MNNGISVRLTGLALLGLDFWVRSVARDFFPRDKCSCYGEGVGPVGPVETGGAGGERDEGTRGLEHLSAHLIRGSRHPRATVKHTS